jgi:outer membrane protein assembly factor BamB
MSSADWALIAGLTIHSAGPAPEDLSGTMSRPPGLAWEQHLPGPVPGSALRSELGGPVIDGDLIYVGSAIQDALLVLDRRDGRLIRRLKAHAIVQSPAVVAEGRVYFSDSAGTTWCYPVGSEEPVWSHLGEAPVLAEPVLDADRVYISDVADAVVALDLRNGELVWRHAHRQSVDRIASLELYGAPAPVIAGPALLVGFSDGTFTALTREKGEVAWRKRVGEGKYPDIIAEPVLIGNLAVVGGFTEPLLGLDLGKRTVRWRLDVGSADAALPGSLYTEGKGQRTVVFHGGVDGKLRCVDALTGETIWEWDSGTQSALTRPVGAEAGLFVGAAAGSVYLIDPNSGEKKWSWNPGLHPAGISAPPAVAGRQLLVLTNAGNLLSFIQPETSAAPATPRDPTQP